MGTSIIHMDYKCQGVCSSLRGCPIGAHSNHQLGKVTGMKLDVSVDFVYAPASGGYVNVQSIDFPNIEYFHFSLDAVYVPGS